MGNGSEAQESPRLYDAILGRHKLEERVDGVLLDTIMQR
jgi:hypothetical protein